MSDRNPYEAFRDRIAGTPQSWMDEALCANGDIDPDRWFPDSHERDQASYVARLCQQCPARQRCAEAGKNETWGIWAGETKTQRRKKEAAA